VRFPARPPPAREGEPLSWGLASRWARYPDLRLYRETGDRRALDRVLRTNQALAVKFAAQFRMAHPSLPLRREDCEAAALEGLWKAVRRFDPAKGSFSQAVYWSTRETLSTLLEETVKAVTLNAKLRQTAGFDRTPDELKHYIPEIGDDSTHLEALNSEAAQWNSEDEAEARETLERALEYARATETQRALVAALVSGMELEQACALVGVEEKAAKGFLRRLRGEWEL
jgi:RNA polymerase sigma factor (sigma-70 family)